MRKNSVLGSLFSLAACFGCCTYVSNNPLLTTNGAADADEVRWTPSPKRGSASNTMSGGHRGTTLIAYALGRGSNGIDPANATRQCSFRR